jgi:Alginate lyase
MTLRALLPLALIAGCSATASRNVPPATDAGEAASPQVDGGSGGDSDAPGDSSPETGADSEAGSSSNDAGADSSAPPPWDVLDFSGWALDVPVNAQGQLSGTNDATIVNPISASFPVGDLAYFHSGAAGGVVFYAPVNGATTTSSYYPRCELAEEAYSEAHGGMNWPLTLGGTMNVDVSVDDVPSIHGGTKNGDVVIGQIKGVSSELCKIRYTGGSETIAAAPYTIYVEYNNATVSGSFGVVPVSTIGLSERFSYEIQLANNAYTVSITYQGHTYSGTSGPLDASWSSDTYYFKAGVYTQANSGGQGGDTEGTGAGQVTIRSLEASHP